MIQIEEHVARLEVPVDDRGLRHLMQVLEPPGGVQSDLEPGGPVERVWAARPTCKLPRVVRGLTKGV